MKNLTDEVITEKTCVKRVQAIKTNLITEDLYHCFLNCDAPNCPDYVPVGQTHERYAYLNLYNREVRNLE